jgi:hypothetical protein
MEHNCLLSPLLTAVDIHCRKSHDTTIHNDKYYQTEPKFEFKDTRTKLNFIEMMANLQVLYVYS